MATTPITPTRPGTIDLSTGRLDPMTGEEIKARAEALKQAFEGPLWTPDETDTDESWSEVFRNIDESRPHRPLFEGQY